MAKRIVIDGKVYRYRKGKLVQIPPEWVGKIPHAQTMNKRKSRRGGRRTRKLKNKST